MKILLLAAVLAALPDGSTLKIVADGDVRHPSSVSALAITHDSEKVYVAQDDGWLLRYPLGTNLPHDLRKRFAAKINDIALSPTSDRLAVLYGKGYTAIFDTASFKMLSWTTKDTQVEKVIFAPDGASIYLTTSNGHLAKLRASDMAVEADIFPTDGSRVLAVACSPDGRVIATSDREGNAKFWNGASLSPIATWKIHKDYAVAMKFDPTGTRLVTAGLDLSVKLWMVADGSLVRESSEYHRETVSGIAFGADGQIVTAGRDGLCQFWAGQTLAPIKSYPEYRGYYTACATSPDGRWLVRGGSSLDLVPMNRPESFIRLAEYGGAILGFAVAPDRKHFATGGLDRNLVFWDINKTITSRSTKLDDWATSMASFREGRSVAVGLANGKVEVSSTSDSNREASWAAHEGRVVAVKCSGSRIVTIGDDAKCVVWDFEGKRLSTFDEGIPCRSVAIQGDLLAIGRIDGSITVRYLSGVKAVRQIQGRPLSVTALGFSRDGSRLLVGSFDGYIESFDTSNWEVAGSHQGDGSSVLSIEANPTNDLLLAGYRDGKARILDIVSLKEGPIVQLDSEREIFGVHWIINSHSFAVAGASNGVHFYKVEGDVASWVASIR